jgi:NADPH-dependent ferric siderophore reductase
VTALRVRREPPSFRRVEVRRTTSLTPRLLRVTFGGADLAGFELRQPAASVRLLLPPPGETSLVIPAWNGNEFLRADGTRPTIRTYTPRRFDPDRQELDLDIVVHEHGNVPAWAVDAAPGAQAGISGPGRGYEIDAAAGSFVLAGDESAIPAISQLLEHLPPEVATSVLIEVAQADARHELPHHPGATIQWLDLPVDASPGAALVAAIVAMDVSELDAGGRVWAAGEAAAMQAIRRHLFEERGLTRAQAVVRGYWKQGRGGVDED